MKAFTLSNYVFVTTLLSVLLPGVATGQIGGGTLTITTSPTLPVGTPGTPYSVTLAASGGTQPYTWVALSLPPFLTLSVGGVLSGTPTTANLYTLTIQVTDSSSPQNTAAQTFSLTIGSQGGGASPLTCSVNTSSTPTLRAEGLTEAVGEIVIVCVGGPSLAAGQQATQLNLTVSLTAPVTSRLLKGNVSEALLLIDEPNSGLAGPVPGFGPNEPFTLCKTPQTGCRAWAQQVTGTDGQPYEVAVNAANASPTAANAAPNVYQGVVSGNQVTFFEVPVLPPGSTGVRVLRITNLRLNANGIGGGSPSGSLPVQAAILTSNPSALPLANPTPLVGFVQASLSASAATPTQLAACNSQTLAQAAILTYKELFASAFKTRVDPNVPGQTSGQSGALIQDRPGTIYNSESDFTLAVPGNAPAGLANFGTRFKAVFKVPKGVRVFVSRTNVTVDPKTGSATGQVSSSSTTFAELVTGETKPFAVPAPDAHTPGTNIELVEITPSHESRSATAVWEAVSTIPVAIDTFQFAVFVSYAESVSGARPATVSLSYAPTNVVTDESEESAPLIPRFLAAPSQPVPFLQPCGGRESDDR
jgi:hypothetical protein